LDGQLSGRDGRVEFINVRNTQVGRFLHHSQDRGGGAHAIIGVTLDKQSQTFDRQLLDALVLCGCDTLKAARVRRAFR
jgi:hypothetical protein